MITLIEALNYRCLRYVHQPLDRFHVLVGPNASGKTTFLEVISIIGRVLTDGLDSAIREISQDPRDLLFAHAGGRLELAVEAAIPPEVKADLAAIDLEYAPMIEEAEARYAALEQQVKTEVLAHGATVKGAHVQAVYIKGRVTWDAKALDGYAMDHPELFVFRKEGPPSVSIRAVK